MKKELLDKIVAPLIVAGIVSNFAFWFQFAERLARIETKLEQIQSAKIASPHEK